MNSEVLGKCPVTLKGLPFNGDHVKTFTLSIGNEQGQVVDFNFENSQFLHKNASVQFLGRPCHYSGYDQNGRQAISLCNEDKIAGLFVMNDNNFSLVGNEKIGFVLIPHIKSSCELTNRRSKRAVNRNPPYIAEHMDGRKRYVELAFIADYAMYEKYNKDEAKLTDHMNAIVNMMNSLYYPLNIQISMVYSEIWKEGDKIKVVSEASTTLADFMNFRKTLLKDHLHDNAQLLTGIKFDETVVGKAYKGTMCSYDYSGGVIMDHSENVAVVAGTISHEMGHNFGMDHDAEDICECPVRQCIMSPSAGHLEVWSECSVNYLAKGIQRGIDVCLLNEPGRKAKDAVCGNGIVEEGEQCDCGQEKCSNHCCDGKTCRLVGEAECAAGECCDLNTCRPKDRATVCRLPIGICDLPEFCNGQTSDCPADFFVQNGHLCPERSDEFCYEGICGSRKDQCTKLWGPSGNPSDKDCYKRNFDGTMWGHCGYDVHSETYKKCSAGDQMCGVLHCETEAERPVYGTSNAITFTHSAILKGNEKKYCYVVKSTYVGVKQTDPALVPDGSPCADNKICVGSKCTARDNILKLAPQCEDHCHDRGVCNNVGNCHCERGFGGTACEIPGYGGSVNSNQAYQFRGITLSSIVLFLIILSSIFVVGLCIYYRYTKKRNLIAEWWKVFKKKCNMHGDLMPVRKAPPPPGRKHMRRASLNAMWGDNPVPETAPMPKGYKPKKPLPNFDPPAIPMVSLQPVSSPTPLLHNQQQADQPTYQTKQVTVARNTSMRPKDAPPALPTRPRDDVIEKLYAERGAEMGLNIEQVSGRISPGRPDSAPPPPPIPKNNPVIKPVPPQKPPKEKLYNNEMNNEEATINVKSMAAKFNQKQ